MIYIGKYYKDKGYNTYFNVPRTTEKVEGEKYHYQLVFVNNITKKEIILDNEIDDNIEDDSTSEYYYQFNNLNFSDFDEGEYTFSLYQDEVLVYQGLVTYRNAIPTNSSVYNTETNYIVYE